jgi:hypothetical protein
MRQFRLLLLSLALLTLSALPARAEKKALILAISDYVRQPLPGVAKDVDNAREIARLMGVPAANITVRRDAELAGPGLLKALDDFAATVSPGDQVFIYYSGHGSSYTKRGAAGVCEKALVTQDITFVPREDFHKRLAVLAARAEKTFVFMDSCYSGGLVQLNAGRAFGAGAGPSRGAGSEIRPKFAAASETDPCSVPANVVKAPRDFEMAAAERQPNYYLLGAAGENEVAIDGGKDLGGYASSSLLHCLQNPAESDRDGDGVVTIDEAKACAQNVVDKRLAQSKGASPEFEYSSMTLTSGHGQGGNAPLLFAAAGTSVVNTPAFAQTLFEGRDGKRNVNLASAKNPVRIGEDVSLTVTSDRAGYLTLMVVGSSGKIYRIFPNEMDQDARIEAGGTLPVPRPGRWRMPASAPAGDNWILALVSDAPDRFKGLGENAGIFKSLGDTGAGTRGIFDFLFGSWGKKDKEPAQDDAAPQAAQPASTAYGAALLKITEVD